MGKIDINLLIQLAVYLISIASLGGAVLTRISVLEKKVDKHNSVIERMYKAEGRIEFAHQRIDELRKELKNV